LLRVLPNARGASADPKHQTWVPESTDPLGIAAENFPGLLAL
jgi:hypothetical protein